MAGHNSGMIAGIRWQVWAGVVGGLGGLLAMGLFLMQPKPKLQAKQGARKTTKAKSSDHAGWGSGGASRGGQRRQAKPKDHSKALAAIDARLYGDGGTRRDGLPTPERSTEREKPKFKKPGWLRGKVLGLPGRKPIKKFTIRYARLKGSSWGTKKGSLKESTAFPKDAVIIERTFTHAKGHFDIQVEVGRYLMEVKAKGYQPGTPAAARARASGWFRRTFALLVGGRSVLKGRVLGRGARPVPGALAVALLAGGSRWGWRMISFGRSAPSSSRMATADDNGEFEINNLPAGKYGVIVRARGYTGWRKKGILVADGEHKDLGTITLDGNTGTITGTVYGPDAKGKSGAMVVAMSQGKGRRNVKFSRTDSNGKYTLEDVAAGKVRVYSRLGRGMLAARRMHNLTLKSGETKRHDFHFGQGGMRLSGKVYDAQGAPVPDAKISALAGRARGAGASLSSGNATTDKEGNYEIAGLKKGLHTISISIKGKPSDGGNVDIKQAENQHDIRLRGGSIVVSFLDKTTKKAPKVPIWAILTWKDVKTHRLALKADPGKTVTFEHLPDKNLSLRLFSPGYAAQTQSVRPGLPESPKQLTLTLSPAGKFLLNLQAPKGAQITRVFAQINIDGKYQWLFAQATASGEYEINGLPPGAVQLKIVAAGFKPLEVTIEVPTKGTGRATFALVAAAPVPKPAPQ